MRLTDKLNNLKEDSAISMHVPGHKNMTIGALGNLEWTYDMTEIMGLDDLHSPDDVLLELNDFLKRKSHGYHAQAVVNGTTTGILSAMFAVKDDIGKFLVVDDGHKSVYHGINLTKMPFELISSDKVLETDVKNAAVIITYPTYSGNAIPGLGKIINYIKESEGIVIVDEAHGAHHGITDNFLPSALSHDADIVIQSYHKMLPALTGASVVFTKNGKRHGSMMKFIDHFETSSPSYLILASIELAQQFYNDFDDEVFFNRRNDLIEKLESSGFSVSQPDDPAKLTINMEGISPYKLSDALDEAGIYSEMVTEEGVLWCLPLFHSGDGYPLGLLYERLDSLSLEGGEDGCREVEDLSFLLGKPAVRSVVPYPPGVPIINEGEHFTGDVLKSIAHKKFYHVKMEGIEDNIEVYKVEGEA